MKLERVPSRVSLLKLVVLILLPQEEEFLVLLLEKITNLLFNAEIDLIMISRLVELKSLVLLLLLQRNKSQFLQLITRMVLIPAHTLILMNLEFTLYCLLLMVSESRALH